MTVALSPRSRLAIVLYGFCVVNVVIGVLTSSNADRQEGEGIIDTLMVELAFLAYATVGTMILVRQPDNTVGWLLGAVGFFPAMGGATEWYVERLAGGPLADVALWFSNWYFVAALYTLPLLFLVFPDGRPASKLWRWPVLVTGLGLAALLLFYMVGPENSNCDGDSAGDCEINPFQPAVLRPLLGPLEVIGTTGMIVGLVAGFVSLGWRFHRARGAERQQVKWFAASIALALVVVVVPVPRSTPLVENGLFALMLVLPAVGVGVAVLRYRLYDIDRLISRSISYGLVTALILGVYLALVTAATRLLPDGSSLAVAASTLAVAALFQPLRRRVQSLVDRRFNRASYDAVRTVEDFSARLRAEVDLDAVRIDLLSVVDQTLEPTHTSLWLRPGRERS